MNHLEKIFKSVINPLGSTGPEAPQLFNPSFRHQVRLRRLLALCLLVAAAGTTLFNYTQRDPEVLVFASSFEAGHRMSAEDVKTQSMPPQLIPESALSPPESEDITTAVLVSDASAGEVVTRARFLGGHLVPEGHTLVPVVLAEPEIIGLLTHGTRVSIVTTAQDGSHAVIVAPEAQVISAGEESTGSANTVLVALEPQAALAVAAASLATPLAAVITG